MNRKYAPLVAIIALSATLGTACSNGADDNDAATTSTTSAAATSSATAGTSSAAAPSSAAAASESMSGMVMPSSAAPAAAAAGLGTETASAELRAGLTALLQEHVYLAGIATGTALNPAAGPKSEAFTAAAATLDKNSVALSKAIEGAYGAPAGEQFLALWRKHIGFFVDYTLGAAGKDDAMKKKAVADLDGYRADFGAFLESANPNLPKQAVADELKPHVATLAAAVDAQAAGSPDAFAKLQEAASHMPMTAAVLAGGIAKQKELAGDPNGGGSELRSLLTAQLQEHVYLAGLATGTALDPKQGPKSKAFTAAADTLDKNSIALSKSIESVYGAPAGEQFLALWRKHIGFFVDYTLGAAGKDQAMKDKAVADLDGYRADFGAFLESANPNLPKQVVADELKPHVETLAAAVEAQAAGTPDAVAKLQEAAAHMPMTAKILAGAIAKQFPDKFPA